MHDAGRSKERFGGNQKNPLSGKEGEVTSIRDRNYGDKELRRTTRSKWVRRRETVTVRGADATPST